MSTPEIEVPEIDVADLARLRAGGEVTLIDVREPDEYEGAHVPGARHIQLGTVPERIHEVPLDGGPVYVICARGGRSMTAATYYRAQGIEAVNVAGGTLAWIDAGQPTNAGMKP